MIDPHINNLKGLTITDETLKFDIPLEQIFQKYITATKLFKLNMYFTFSDKKILELLHNYYIFSTDLDKNVKNLIISFHKEHFSTYDISELKEQIIEEENGINIGIDKFDKTIYIFNNIVILSSRSNQFLEVIYKDINNLEDNLFLVVKVIESRASLLNIKEGTFIIHGDLYKDKSSKLTLALGPSLSGKTTYLRREKCMDLIGDELICITNSCIFPLVNYVRDYVFDHNLNNTYYENFKGIKRIVSNNIPIMAYRISELKEIDILYRSNINKKISITNERDVCQVLINYFNNGILHPFMPVQQSNERLVSLLSKKIVNIIYHKSEEV